MEYIVLVFFFLVLVLLLSHVSSITFFRESLIFDRLFFLAQWQGSGDCFFFWLLLLFGLIIPKLCYASNFISKEKCYLHILKYNRREEGGLKYWFSIFCLLFCLVSVHRCFHPSCHQQCSRSMGPYIIRSYSHIGCWEIKNMAQINWLGEI